MKKTWQVCWRSERMNYQEIEASVPEEAYKQFLESQVELRYETVEVYRKDNLGIFLQERYDLHLEKAEDVQETGPDGGSGGKTKQASAASSSSDQLEKILLRIETAQNKTNFYLRFCAIAAFAVVLFICFGGFKFYSY
jgi:hypothetical protein